MLGLGPDTSSFTVSVSYIFFTAALLKFVRSWTLQLQSFKSKGSQILLLEFLATFEMIACVFEMGVVIENHGMLAYAAVTLIMFNYWGSAWQSATAAPHPHIIDVIHRKSDLKQALLKILVQVAAASLVYPLYVKPFWSFGYKNTHLERVQAARCFTHLQVPVPIGVIVEALATFSFMTALQIFAPKKYSFLSLPLILVSIVYAGMALTGCYFNPILASAIQFGCEGITAPEHFLVYWVGPILGSLAFSRLSSRIVDPFDNNSRKLK